MPYKNESTLQVMSLCSRAVAATLTLDAFYREWPQKANTDSFLNIICEDVENGVEHTPGKFPPREVDLEGWNKTWLCFSICLDLALLDLDYHADELINCRKTILRKWKLSRGAIHEEIQKYFSSSRPQ
jgi:hypothetical protein